jgi:uncharacterized membrane-anchored protein YitT (DUF2179 family)
MSIYLTIIGAALIVVAIGSFFYGWRIAPKTRREGGTSGNAVFFFIGFGSFAMGSLLFFLGFLNVVQ